MVEFLEAGNNTLQYQYHQKMQKRSWKEAIRKGKPLIVGKSFFQNIPLKQNLCFLFVYITVNR